MKEYIVSRNEEGMTLHKYLLRVLPAAGGGFLYKMLRKKNILLNGKKASGNEKLSGEDRIRVYFSDETLEKFEAGDGRDAFGTPSAVQDPGGSHGAEPWAVTAPERNGSGLPELEVLYENEDILAANKPAGILSQKASPRDDSLNEMLLRYLLAKGEVTQDSLKLVRPSVCNRLDRNTSGIVLCGKTMKGLQTLSEALKSRSAHKYYRAWVLGRMEGRERLEGYLCKDERRNQVTIRREPAGPEDQYICTEYQAVEHNLVPGREVTLLEILLVTGRSHQIRAHLASIGHPLLGDPKYGDLKLNRELMHRCNIRRQLLHSYRTELEGIPEIICPLPPDMLPEHWKRG